MIADSPANVIVARARIDDGVAIEAAAPPTVRMVPGQRLDVKFAYQLREASKEREEYRFLLRSRLAGHEAPPAMARIGDKWGLPDDTQSFVQQQYVASQPGQYDLEFTVEAEYVIADWKSGQVLRVERREHKGAVKVVVH